MFRRLFRNFLVSAILLSTIIAYAQEDLIFAVTLIRHGDRSPYAKLESTKIKYQWPQGIGELSPEGMRQEYMLGQELRKRYIDTYHLLPESYQNGTMYVLSTDYNRTLMSVESLLIGLYPPGTGPKLSDGSPALPNAYQPVPIHITPPKQKNIINPEISDKEQFSSLLNKYSFTQQTWIDENNKHSEDFKRWGEILGVKINNLDDVLIPSDNVYCMTMHGIALPKELTKEDTDKIIETKMYACALRFVPKEMATFMASGFFSKLKTDMQSAVKEEQPYYKYTLYSGHDDSILGIMSALNAPLKNNPPYASHVDFELYKDGSDYIVKVFYNGKPVKLAKDKDYCTLKEFTDIIAPCTAN